MKSLNLLGRGPAKTIKDGVAPLEGLIETDWATSSFTMNWKVARPFESIRFQKGDPICRKRGAPGYRNRDHQHRRDGVGAPGEAELARV